jgi:hypothetical protein
MRELEPIKPTLDLPMTVAVEELTGFEIMAIERHFKEKFENFGAMWMLMGTVWAFETRAAGKPVPWGGIEHMSMRQLNGYFEPEPDDVMPEDPDSELGKASSPGD